MTHNDAPPIVCTLTIGRLDQQWLEWTDLASHALAHREIPGGVTSWYPTELADQIEELAARELDCCGSWLQIEHERTNERLQLRLTTTNPDGVAFIRSLSGL